MNEKGLKARKHRIHTLQGRIKDLQNQLQLQLILKKYELSKKEYDDIKKKCDKLENDSKVACGNYSEFHQIKEILIKDINNIKNKAFMCWII